MANIVSILEKVGNVSWDIITYGHLPFTLAFIMGLAPALIWLWFWLREDSKNPEPKRLIVLTFLSGFAAVICVIPLQKITAVYLGSSSFFILFLLWAAIEEAVKFLWCYFVALRNRENNEPIDATMYMIITALGFAAFENALYVLSPLIEGNIIEGLLTSNFRFMGTSLLHVLASAVIGIFISLSYYQSKRIRIEMALIGLAIAVLLHTLFNFLIIKGNGAKTFLTFSLVWIGIGILLAFFEIIKRIKPTSKYGKR